MRKCEKFRRRVGRAAWCFVVGVLGVSFAVGAAAQSGRRGNKTSAQAAETAKPSTEVKTGESAAAAGEADKQPAVKFKIVVGGDLPKDVSPRATTIYNRFVARLMESPLVDINSVGLLKREAATARARGETDTYVVWLDMEKDSFQGGSVMINSQDLKLTYNVLEPGTAKALAKGKVFYQAMGGGGQRGGSGGVGSTPVKITPEAAGIEIAEMVLEWFSRPENKPKSEQK